MARIYNVPFNVTKGSLIKRQIKENGHHKSEPQIESHTPSKLLPAAIHNKWYRPILVLVNNPLGNAQEITKNKSSIRNDPKVTR